MFLCFYRSFILVKDLVVLRHGHTEDDGCHVLETVDPFFPLWSLASHVKQLEVEVFEWEVNLHNARSLDPGPQDVLLGRLVVLGSQSVQIVKETEKEKFWYFSYRPETRMWNVLFLNVKTRWLCIIVIVWRSEGLSWWKVIFLERIRDKSLELLLYLWRSFEKVIKRKVRVAPLANQSEESTNVCVMCVGRFVGGPGESGPCLI